MRRLAVPLVGLLLLVVTLALATRAEAFVYWANTAGDSIGRSNLDGTGVDRNFITGAHGPCAVAVDDRHVYWVNPSTGAIGRANLDGTGVDVKSRGGAKKKLNSNGKAKVDAKVTFTPDGAEPRTERKRIKLIRR